MKKIIVAGASALFLSSSAIAGVFYDTNPNLSDKDPSLAPMEVSFVHAFETGDKKSAMVMQHPDGGMAGYTGVGGPDEEVRVYPRCRSRSDDRCQQGS